MIDMCIFINSHKQILNDLNQILVTFHTYNIAEHVVYILNVNIAKFKIYISNKSKLQHKQYIFHPPHQKMHQDMQYVYF